MPHHTANKFQEEKIGTLAGGALNTFSVQRRWTQQIVERSTKGTECISNSIVMLQPPLEDALNLLLLPDY